MALGKYSRIDVRKSSTSYCSTVTFVVFVGLCLVGVWMMTSSSIVPVQNVDETTQESKNEVQTQLKEASKTSTDDDDTSIDNNPNTEGNTSSDANSNSDQSSTSSDNNLNAESNTSITSNLNSESNTSNDRKEESSTSDSESNTDSDGTKINTDGESSTSVSAQSTSGSNTNSDGTKTNTNSTIEGTSGSNTDNEGSTNSDSTGGSSKSNESDQPKQFEDNPGDLPDDATKGDNVTVSSNAKSSSQPEKTTSEHPADDNQETKPLNQQSREEDTNREKGSKSDTGNEQDKKEDGVSGTKNKESNDGEKKSETDEKKHIDEKTYGAEISDEPQNKSKAEDKIEVKKADEIAGEKKELLPSGAQSELLNETVTGDRAWKTQAAQSQKEADKSSEPSENTGSAGWKLCNVTTGADYIPCLDNMQAIKKLRTTKHYEHRERHCPDEPPTCLVLLPEGYQRSVEWPTSREKIWYHNVPHTELAKFKGHQNWVKLSGEYLTFPGGGTQFMHGALHYIDFIQQIAPDIAWGKRSRVVLDVGCGVASFGGFLFDRDTLTMSFAPKDEHEAQVQFALERGIPAFLAVMGTKRLPFPGRVFDIVHCARCRVPWHIEGGKLLLELNRLLRPGGYFVWSATPVYQKETEDVQIWEAMKKLLKAMCWEVVSIGKDRINKVGIAIFQKPSTNECYERRSEKEPPLCNDSDDPNASWNVPLQACMHKIPVGETERGSKWPELWPERVQKPPYWLLSSQVGVYGKPAPDDFVADYEHWKRVVTKSYVTGMGINWSMVRNVMDMKAIYGGFAAALREMNVWVMNVVNIDSPDTLPIIYERGLFGMYHDWCESFNTYPRTYDLIHADHLFSKIKKNCNFEALVAEVDRILRPEGKLIVRDKAETIRELDTMFKSMQWEVRMTYAKDKEGLLCVKKSIWRPTETITLPYAICPKGDCDRTRYN